MRVGFQKAPTVVQTRKGSQKVECSPSEQVLMRVGEQEHTHTVFMSESVGGSTSVLLVTQTNSVFVHTHSEHSQQRSTKTRTLRVVGITRLCNTQ